MIFFNLIFLKYSCLFIFFFFNDTATTEIYTLSLHDALPIYRPAPAGRALLRRQRGHRRAGRSEEHTSELQSRFDLVCRLLLEKKNINQFSFLLSKKKKKKIIYTNVTIL